MSNSQLKCPPDVQLDISVRFSISRTGREEDALRSEGYLTIVDAAQALGVTRNTVSATIADGRLHATRWEDRWVTRAEWISDVTCSRKSAAQWPRANGWLSVAEAAALLGITRQALNVRINRKMQPAVCAGADTPTPGAGLIRVADVHRQVA